MLTYVGRQGGIYFILNNSCDRCCDGVSPVVCASAGVCLCSASAKVLKCCSASVCAMQCWCVCSVGAELVQCSASASVCAMQCKCMCSAVLVYV